MTEFKDIINKIKIHSDFHFLYWSTALAGETGEFCNRIKKYVRDKVDIDITRIYLADELADIFIYTAINAMRWNIDLEQAIKDKIKTLEIRNLHLEGKLSAQEWIDKNKQRRIL